MFEFIFQNIRRALILLMFDTKELEPGFPQHQDISCIVTGYSIFVTLSLTSLTGALLTKVTFLGSNQENSHQKSLRCLETPYLESASDL